MNNVVCDLSQRKCVPCEGGVPKLTESELKPLLAGLAEWELKSNPMRIYKRYSFKDFYHTMAFVNAIAWVANSENHHPDLEVGYNYCAVSYHTHAIDGLSENDFICAAKIEQLLNPAT